MATYNGAAHVGEQITSVLPQLGSSGEVIVVDDASCDGTVAALESFGDPRIRICRQESNRGAIMTFERALEEAKGDIIFLSDQDDIWHGNKVEVILKTFERLPHVTLVMSNAELIDASGRSLGNTLHQREHVPLGLIPNLFKNRFQGCTIAFRRELLDAILPFPDGIPMHDSWIGLVNAIVGKAAYISEPLMQYRRHGGNVTSGKHGRLGLMMAQRWRLGKALIRRAGVLMYVRRSLRAEAAMAKKELQERKAAVK
jgi:glycosyltransferase involved in cell wall biosynthesis